MIIFLNYDFGKLIRSIDDTFKCTFWSSPFRHLSSLSFRFLQHHATFDWVLGHNILLLSRLQLRSPIYFTLLLLSFPIWYFSYLKKRLLRYFLFLFCRWIWSFFAISFVYFLRSLDQCMAGLLQWIFRWFLDVLWSIKIFFELIFHQLFTLVLLGHKLVTFFCIQNHVYSSRSMITVLLLLNFHFKSLCNVSYLIFNWWWEMRRAIRQFRPRLWNFLWLEFLCWQILE